MRNVEVEAGEAFARMEAAAARARRLALRMLGAVLALTILLVGFSIVQGFHHRAAFDRQWKETIEGRRALCALWNAAEVTFKAEMGDCPEIEP